MKFPILFNEEFSPLLLFSETDFISFKANKFLLIIVINIFLTTLRLFIPKEMSIRWIIKIRSFLRNTNCWANYVNSCSY